MSVIGSNWTIVDDISLVMLTRDRKGDGVTFDDLVKLVHQSGCPYDESTVIRAITEMLKVGAVIENESGLLRYHLWEPDVT